LFCFTIPFGRTGWDVGCCLLEVLLEEGFEAKPVGLLEVLLEEFRVTGSEVVSKGGKLGACAWTWSTLVAYLRRHSSGCSSSYGHGSGSVWCWGATGPEDGGSGEVPPDC
jgi:hypothetical protein